jgi:excinuclease ABC subunit C
MAAFRQRFPLAFFSELPASPGVYFMWDAEGKLLYIGKAKSLRSRLLSYRSAKASFLKRVSRITWEKHKTIERASRRENELIHALTPPCNVADCWEEDYLYIGLRERMRGHWQFRLTSREDREAGEFELFGCYRHRRQVKDGYTALLRLLYAAFIQKSRFSFPAKIARDIPPYDYELPFALPREYRAKLRAFFSGKSPALIRILLVQMLENETLPRFMRPALQADVNEARRFFESCAKANLKARRGLITHREMREHVRKSVAQGR